MFTRIQIAVKTKTFPALLSRLHMSLWRRTDHPTSLMSRTTGELSIQDIFRDSPVVLSSDVAKPPGRGRCLVHVLAT